MIYPPVFYVILRNKSSVDIRVHDVRVHYGGKDYNHYIQLNPENSEILESKNKLKYVLPDAGTIVGKITAHPKGARVRIDDYAPSFDTPANLIQAMANGNAKDSWVEIDFNDRTRYMSHKDHVKGTMALMIDTGTRLAKKIGQS